MELQKNKHENTIKGHYKDVMRNAKRLKPRERHNYLVKVDLDDEPDVNNVINTVCEFFNVSKMDLKTIKNQHIITRPRGIAIYLLRKYTKLNDTEIAALFSIHRTTMMYHYHVVNDEKNVYRSLQATINALLGKIKELKHIA